MKEALVQQVAGRGDADRKEHGRRVRAPWIVVEREKGRAEFKRLEGSSQELVQQAAG